MRIASRIELARRPVGRVPLKLHSLVLRLSSGRGQVTASLRLHGGYAVCPNNASTSQPFTSKCLKNKTALLIPFAVDNGGVPVLRCALIIGHGVLFPTVARRHVVALAAHVLKGLGPRSQECFDRDESAQARIS